MLITREGMNIHQKMSHTQFLREFDTHMYLKPIILPHIKLRHLHTGFKVNLSVQVIFLYT